MPLPWFQRQGDQLPKELEGMEPADLAAAVAKSKEVDTLKQQLADQNTKLSEFDALKSKVASLEANSNRQPPPKPENEPKRPTSFLEDEDAAFTERLAPVAAHLFETQAQNAKFMAHQTLNATDKKIWDKYQDEIENVMKSIAPPYRAQAQTWKNALDTVSGRHREEIFKMAQDRTEFFSESVSSNGGGMASSNPDAPLNDEERKIATRMGLTEDEYKANKKAMVVRNG